MADFRGRYCSLQSRPHDGAGMPVRSASGPPRQRTGAGLIIEGGVLGELHLLEAATPMATWPRCQEQGSTSRIEQERVAADERF